MAVDLTLQTITSGYNTSKINSNFAAINVALQDALSRSGFGPNTMTADLDLNNNDLLNAGNGAFSALTIGGVDVHNLTGSQGLPGLAGSKWFQGNADPSNANGVVNDFYLQLTVGATGIIGDVWLKGASVWTKVGNIRGAQGTTGAGTGDMLKANNLSDVISASTSLSNLGGAPLASPTLTGVPAAPTATADTTTTQLATTAFVIGQASSSTPIVDGTGTIGTSKKYARADHVHPSDTAKANLASPTFTGVPAAPTATVGTNTTQLATTAFVLANNAATAGGLTLVSTLSPSAASTINTGTLTTGHKAFHIVFSLTATGTSGHANMYTNISSDGGSTWDSDCGIMSGITSSSVTNGVLDYHSVSINSFPKYIVFNAFCSAGIKTNDSTYFNTKTGLTNCIRFLIDSGGMTGTIYVYGVD